MTKNLAESLAISPFIFTVRTNSGCATFGVADSAPALDFLSAESATFSIPMDKNGLVALSCKKENAQDLNVILGKYGQELSSIISTEDREYSLFKAPSQPVIKDALTPDVNVLSPASPGQRILATKDARCSGLDHIPSLPEWLEKALCEEVQNIPFTQKNGLSSITELNGAPNNPELFQRYHELGLAPIPIDPGTQTSLIQAPGYGTPKSNEDARKLGEKYPDALCGLWIKPGLAVVSSENSVSSHEFGLRMGSLGINIDYTSRTIYGSSTAYIFSSPGNVPFKTDFLGIKGVNLRGTGGFFVSGPGKDSTGNIIELVDVGLLELPASLIMDANVPAPIILASEKKASSTNVHASESFNLSESEESTNHSDQIIPSDTNCTPFDADKQKNQEIDDSSYTNDVSKEKKISSGCSIRMGMRVHEEEPLSEAQIKAHPNYHNFEIARKPIEKGLRVCWVEKASKKPLYGEKSCGDKQGLTLDENTLWKRFIDKDIIDIAMPLMEVTDEFCVLDLDKHNDKDGEAPFNDLCQAHNIDLSAYPQVRSQSGGMHIYCKKPSGIDLKNAPFPSKANSWGDIKTTGGLVAVPGAMGKKGKYEIVNGDPLDFANLPEFPEPVLRLIIDSSRKNKATGTVGNEINHDCATERGSRYLDWCCSKIAAATEGVRNITLYEKSKIMGRLIKKGEISENLASEQLIEAGCKCGLSYSDCKNTVKSGIAHGISTTGEFTDFLGIGENAGSSTQTTQHRNGANKNNYSELAKRADSQYRESRFAEFANRDGEPDYNEIGKFVLPQKYWKQAFAFAKENALSLRAILLSIVCAIGAAIGALRGVRYSKKANGFCCANTFLINIGAKACGKSDTLDFCYAPMRTVEERYYIKFKEDYKQYRKDKEEWDNTPREKRGPSPEKPIQKSFLLEGDTTTERLTTMMMENPHGLTSLSDEGRGLIKNFTRYNPSAADDIANKLIASFSNSPISAQRQNHEGEFRDSYIPVGNLAMYANIQPEIFYNGKIFSKDDEAQGLTPRFIYNLFPDRPDGEYSAAVDGETEESKEDFEYRFQVFWKLANLTPHVDEHTKAQRPLLLEFSPDARKLINEWSREASRAVNYGKTCKAYYSRLLITLYRFALIMHYFHWACAAIENGDANVPNPDGGYIEEIDVKRAIQMVLICFRTLDEVLWQMEKPKFPTIKYLDDEQQEFARFVMAHPRESSMTVREMANAGLDLAKDARRFAQLLRKWGVHTERRRVPGKSQKYLLSIPTDWEDSINIKRLYFDGNNLDFYAQAILAHKDEIESMGHRVPKATFESWLGLEFDELGNPEQMVPVIKLQPLNVTEFNGMLCFLPESFVSAEEILKGGK